MKHIFTVHSPITFFSALNIVRKLQIPEENIIFLLANYTPPFKIGLSVPAFQVKNRSLFEKLKRINLPICYDSFIDDLTNRSEFIAYIDLMHSYQRILVTHKMCVSFNFMEEGTASYILPKNLLQLAHTTKNKVGFRSTTIRDYLFSFKRVLRGNTLSLVSLPYFPQAYSFFPYTFFYTFSRNGYPGIPGERKKILEPQISASDLEKLAQGFDLSYSYVWIEEAYPDVFGISKKNYRTAILKTLKKINTNKAIEIWLKFRPRQEKNSSVVYKTLVSEGVSVRCLPEDILLESIFLNSIEIKVIGLVSSLLFYASIFGHEALSFYDQLHEKPNSHFDGFDVYWDKVKKI